MNFQKINVKFFLEKGADIPLSAFIPVFHRWIQQDKLEGLIIDVAEYTHVQQGPGVFLVAHEANYRLEEAEGKRGILYNQKRVPAKSAEGHLRTSFQRGLAACALLEGEPEVSGKIKFQPGHFQVSLNDRLEAPPTPESRQELEKALKTFLNSLYGGASCRFSPETDGQKRLGFEVKVEGNFEAKRLLEKLKAN